MSGGEFRTTQQKFIRDSVRGLMSDSRASALEMMIGQQKDELVRYMTSPHLSVEHGRLAHSAGGVDALNHLLAVISEIKNSSKEK